MLDQLPDGVWLVELAAVADGTEVRGRSVGVDGSTGAVARRSREGGGPTSTGSSPRCDLEALCWCSTTASTSIDAAATLADRLLAECPRLRVLATSREPLGITGEALWPVDPLGLPPEDVDSRDLLGYDAVRLLVDRARAVRPGFTVTNDNASAVGRICRRPGRHAAGHRAGRGADAHHDRGSAGRTARRPVPTAHRRKPDRGSAASDTAGGRRLELGAALRRRAESCCGGWRSSPAVRRWRPRSGCAPTPSSQQIRCPTWSPRSSTSRCWWSPATKYRGTGCSRPSRRTAWSGSTRRQNAKPSAAHTPRYFVELAETAEPHLRRAEQLVWLRRLKADHDNLNAALRGSIAAGDAQTAVRFVAAAGLVLVARRPQSGGHGAGDRGTGRAGGGR